MLILASRSPRREELLEAMGIEFRVMLPAVGERPRNAEGGRYSDLVRRAALDKARSVATRGGPVVLGADTIVVCGKEVLGKPRDPAEARRMLGKLSGRWHQVYTGVALVKGERSMTGYERTEVGFRPLSKREIDWYVASGEPLDKAGAYAVQGRGAGLIRGIRGCYTNVIGLPVPKLMEMLAEFRGPPEGTARGGTGWESR